MNTLALQIFDTEPNHLDESDWDDHMQTSEHLAKEADALHEKPLLVRPIFFEGQIAFKVNACKYIP